MSNQEGYVSVVETFLTPKRLCNTRKGTRNAEEGNMEKVWFSCFFFYKSAPFERLLVAH